MNLPRIYLMVILYLTIVVGTFGQDAPKVEQKDNSWMLWENKVGKRWLLYHLEKEEAAQLKLKWDQVGASLEGESNQYAGTYYVSDWMSGYFLRWSPSAGYIFVRYFDVEHPCYFSYGQVEQAGNIFRFVHEGEASHSACPTNNTGRPDTEWIPALGGAYFVPRNEVRRFADFYGGFGEYNGYLRTYESGIPFAFKWGSKKPSSIGFVLPEQFAKFVKKPITGQITSVSRTVYRKPRVFRFAHELETVTPVTINVGSINGVTKGQEFVLLTNDDGRSETLIATRIGKRASSAVVIRTVIEKKKEGFYVYDYGAEDMRYTPFTKLKTGIKITTSSESKL